MSAQDEPTFPVVGIGASAGGLEALQAFLRAMPSDSGLAFIIVQHLDPLHKAMLVDILQRATAMPVLQAAEGLAVEPDHVYVIPPNKDLSLACGTLHMRPRPSSAGPHLPVDFFFRSLAADRQDGAIAVILSGMGTDGTLGLRAIKEGAGATFVQAPESAKFDGMPRNAIREGLADVVAPPEELPGKILTYFRHNPHLRRTAASLESTTAPALDEVLLVLRAQTGNDFSSYKRSTIRRRIERRMALHQLSHVPEYVRFLRDNPREAELLIKELLIGVTSFFRDPEFWQHLTRLALPRLLSERLQNGTLRAWVAGCSTGEEAYSLAIAFKEAAEPLESARGATVQIFATDLDSDAIEKARQALYPDSIAADVSPERLRRFFVQEEGGYRVSKEIRDMVVFAPQNIITDPPFTRLDLLSCRNLLIYLSSDLQKKLIPRFHYSLNPGGLLLLGSAETVATFSNLFAPVEGKLRIYRRLNHGGALAPIDFPSSLVLRVAGSSSEAGSGEHRQRDPAPNLQMLADRVLVQRFSPVGVLCTAHGDVLYVSSRAGKYLEPAVGKSNLNIFAMAREGLRYPLSRAFSETVRDGRAVTVEGVKVGTNGGTQYLDLTVQRLSEPRELRGNVMVVLADTPARTKRAKSRAGASTDTTELEEELERARDEAQTVREEMQTSQEELKSTNEELQSTNEELQSTNEELTTSKEEMQSLNEELQTVNQELQAKVDELSRSNNDMKNLLNSADVATLFLDQDLRVRRFTTPTTRIIKLIPGDTGRPITDIASDLYYPNLADDAQDVLQTLVFKEKLVAARDGRWFTVRVMPYRTLENVIDGVIITFTDASVARALEEGLRARATSLEQMAESLPGLVWSCRSDGSFEYVSTQWQQYTGAPRADHLGDGWLDKVHPEDRERVRTEWHAALRSGQPSHMQLRLRSSTGVYRWFEARSAPSRDEQGRISRWYGILTNADHLEDADAEPALSDERLRSILDSMTEAFVGVSESASVEFLNAAAERLLGRARREVIGKPLWAALPELGSAVLEQKLTLARERQQPVTFETHANGVPSAEAAFRVRIHPQGEGAGLSILLERISKLPRDMEESAEVNTEA